MARILLIDDDSCMRTTLGLILVKLGHTVIEACNGAEGLNLFPGANADLVITDMVMPEKEGLEVLMSVRKQQPWVKVIAMSGNARLREANVLHAAKCLGAACVLEKPFLREALVLAVNASLAGGAGPAPAAHVPGFTAAQPG